MMKKKMGVCGKGREDEVMMMRKKMRVCGEGREDDSPKSKKNIRMRRMENLTRDLNVENILI